MSLLFQDLRDARSWKPQNKSVIVYIVQIYSLLVQLYKPFRLLRFAVYLLQFHYPEQLTRGLFLGDFQKLLAMACDFLQLSITIV